MPRITVITVSDRCFNGSQIDQSGPAVVESIGKVFSTPEIEKLIVPDDCDCIKSELIRIVDEGGVDLIITTGGTGFSERDVTPEATRSVIDKEAPSLSTVMLLKSIHITPLGALSRACCGIRKQSLILNVPGSPKAARECIAAVENILPHALDLLGNKKEKVSLVHSKLNNAEPPKLACKLTNYKMTNLKADIIGNKSTMTGVAYRDRHSKWPMLSVDQAVSMVISKSSEINMQTEQKRLSDLVGCVLAEDIKSPINLPPFPASIKDGYSVLASDGSGPRHVVTSVTAGFSASKPSLEPSQCIRVNTGAVVVGDAVVQVEDTSLLKASASGEEMIVDILMKPQIGQDIRSIGSDIKHNEIVLSAGTCLSPSDIGLIASIGLTSVIVYTKPSVCVFSTGDELVEPGDALGADCKIYDSNRIVLLTELRRCGFNPVDGGILCDDVEFGRMKLGKSLQDFDVTITSGAVSMGERDFVKPVLTDLGADVHFARVCMKPGKPTTFATLETPEGKTKLFFGLPGNPVSAVVTCQLYVLPALHCLSGLRDLAPFTVPVQLGMHVSLDSRVEYRRATLHWTVGEAYPTAHSTGNQRSSRLLSMSSARALLILPAATSDCAVLKEGSVVPAMLLDH